MKRVHVLVAGAAVALFVAAAGALSGVAATTLQSTRSHGHSTTPAIQAEATKPADPCKAGDPAEDTLAKAAEAKEAASEKAAKLTKAADKIEDANEKPKAKAESKGEKTTLQACEAARKKKTTTV